MSIVQDLITLIWQVVDEAYGCVTSLPANRNGPPHSQFHVLPFFLLYTSTTYGFLLHLTWHVCSVHSKTYYSLSPISFPPKPQSAYLLRSLVPVLGWFKHFTAQCKIKSDNGSLLSFILLNEMIKMMMNNLQIPHPFALFIYLSLLSLCTLSARIGTVLIYQLRYLTNSMGGGLVGTFPNVKTGASNCSFSSGVSDARGV